MENSVGIRSILFPPQDRLTERVRMSKQQKKIVNRKEKGSPKEREKATPKSERKKNREKRVTAQRTTLISH